jgi:hypothetical protein
MSLCASCAAEVEAATCPQCGSLQPGAPAEERVTTVMADQRSAEGDGGAVAAPPCVPAEAGIAPALANVGPAVAARQPAPAVAKPDAPPAIAPESEPTGIVGAHDDEEVASAAREPYEPADDRDRQGEKLLSVTFKRRRLVLKGLKFPLNVFMYAAIVQAIIVAALLLTQKLPQPQVNSGVQDQPGGTYTVPLAAFVVTAISIVAGYCLALAGALRIRAAAGLPIVLAATVGLATVPISKLRVGGADIEAYSRG